MQTSIHMNIHIEQAIFFNVSIVEDETVYPRDHLLCSYAYIYIYMRTCTPKLISFLQNRSCARDICIYIHIYDIYICIYIRISTRKLIRFFRKRSCTRYFRGLEPLEILLVCCFAKSSNEISQNSAL